MARLLEYTILIYSERDDFDCITWVFIITERQCHQPLIQLNNFVDETRVVNVPNIIGRIVSVCHASVSMDTQSKAVEAKM